MFGPNILILGFHRVLREPQPENGLPDLIISEKFFRAQLRALKRDRDLITFRELSAVGPRDRVALLTFDDGYQDNFTVVAPILAEFEARATFFVTTGFLDGTHFPWWESVYAGLLANGDYSRSGWDALRTELMARELPPEDPVAGIDFLTWDQAQQLVAAGHSVQAHTISHPSLAGAPVNDEIAASTKRVREMTGEEPLVFAYPYGHQGQNFGPREIDQVREAGYQFAVSTDYRPAGRYAMPRLMIGGRDTRLRLLAKTLRLRGRSADGTTEAR